MLCAVTGTLLPSMLPIGFVFGFALGIFVLYLCFGWLSCATGFPSIGIVVLTELRLLFLDIAALADSFGGEQEAAAISVGMAVFGLSAIVVTTSRVITSALAPGAATKVVLLRVGITARSWAWSPTSSMRRG
jgi:hypothetical protein